MNQQGKGLVLLTACVLITVGTLAAAQEPNGTGSLKQEELDQLLAPIALYPDSLLVQIFMASTYPLEVVQANKWIQESNDLNSTDLAEALEQKRWDPGIKSLVNFPDVLQMMSDKLDYTQRLGDAFLSQQKDVMDTVQKLRRKAQEQGNLKSTDQQTVKDDQQSIYIESADSNSTYLPYYDPYYAYGGWWYPTYPPLNWYWWDKIRDRLPPRATPYSGERIRNGAAWGYAWGGCDWRRGNVDVDMSRNANLNSNINRDYYTKNYQKAGQFDSSGKGTWQHNPADRRGVPYRDQATAQRYNRASTADSVQSREAYRGRTEQAGGDIGRDRTEQRRQDTSRDRASQLDNRQRADRRSDVDQRPASRDMSDNRSDRGAAFNGMDNGNAVRDASNRGQISRQSMPQPQMRMPMRGGGRRR